MRGEVLYMFVRRHVKDAKVESFFILFGETRLHTDEGHETNRAILSVIYCLKQPKYSCK